MDEKTKTVPAGEMAERYERLKRLLNENFSESAYEISVTYVGFLEQSQ